MYCPLTVTSCSLFTVHQFRESSVTWRIFLLYVEGYNRNTAQTNVVKTDKIFSLELIRFLLVSLCLTWPSYLPSLFTKQLLISLVPLWSSLSTTYQTSLSRSSCWEAQGEFRKAQAVSTVAEKYFADNSVAVNLAHACNGSKADKNLIYCPETVTIFPTVLCNNVKKKKKKNQQFNSSLWWFYFVSRQDNVAKSQLCAKKKKSSNISV